MNEKVKTVLITGSTGYVCGFVIREILEFTNFNIVATYRNNKGDYPPNKRLVFEKADLLINDSFVYIFEKHNPDYLIHLAAMARVADGESQPVTSLNANLITPISLIKLCKKYNLESSIIASSNLAQNAVSTVGISKLLIEQYIQKINIDNPRFVCYRVPNVIDSNGAVTHIFRRQIANNKPITITHPDMSRMFITGPQAAKEILYLLFSGTNKGIFVSYKKPTKITELAKNMIADSGKKIDIEYIGIKPGEKLTEHSFSADDVIPTDIPFLGKLKETNFNKELVTNAIAKLFSKDEIKSSTETSDFLSSIF